MATATALSNPKSTLKDSWLVNGWIDAIGVIGGGVFISICLYAFWRVDPTLFVIGATAFAMFSDLPHVLQTPMRVLLDPQERALHGHHYFVSLAIVALLVTVLMLTGHLMIMLVIWVVWQFVHVLKQHHGMIAIYCAKAKYAGSKQLAKYVLLFGCAAPFLYRLKHGLAFGNYVLLGHRMPFSGLSIPGPPLPWSVVVLAFVLLGYCLFKLIMEQWQISSNYDVTLPPMAVATLITAVISYNLSYLFVDDLYSLILIATSVHSLQYHLISWRRNNGRFAGHVNPNEARLLLARLSRPKYIWAYALILAVSGFLLANGELFLLGTIPTTLVIHHFYMDGFVWKGKLNPHLAADLGLRNSRG